MSNNSLSRLYHNNHGTAENFYNFDCFQSNFDKILNLPLFFSFFNKMPSQQDGQHLHRVGVEVMHLRMIVHVLGPERDCILAVLLLPYLRAWLRALEEEWERMRLSVLCWRPPQWWWWWWWWHWLSLLTPIGDPDLDHPLTVALSYEGAHNKPKLCHFSTFLLALLSYISIIMFTILIRLYQFHSHLLMAIRDITVATY